MTAERTVSNAIARSITHNEIVTLRVNADDMQDVLDALSVESDDCSPSNCEYGTTEFWGTTESCSEWRVHVTVA
jgi:hypothetical protein